MILAVLFLILNVAQQGEPEVPLKPNDEFQLTVDYKFKTRSALSTNSNLNIDYANDRILKEGGSGPMPYLIIKFKMLKLSEQETRVKVISNASKMVLSKKVKEGEDFDLDLGYTDDMKDRVSAFEYSIYFLSAEKKSVSRVQLFIMEDGTFLVNGEKRGKF
jgi:hypothetical protein